MAAPSLRDERGIALAVAIFALVVIGALVAGAFFAGRLELRGGQNALQSVQAFEAAEAGITDAITPWDRSLNQMGVGTTQQLAARAAVSGTSAAYTTSVTRLNENVFLVRSEGEQLDAGNNVLARRMLGALVKLTPPDIQITSAVTIRGRLTLGGSSFITGRDETPSNWTTTGPEPLCEEPTETVTGIRGSNLQITTNGSNCRDLGCVVGDPRLQEDSTVNASTFTVFGDMTFDEMAQMADKVVTGTLNQIRPSVFTPVPPAIYGRCNTGDPANWGEVAMGTVYQECLDYFPIIYAPGNLKLTGGKGQGILLVRGDLELSGGVEFYGPVITLGTVKSTGTGGHIYGGLMASNADLEANTITGNSVVSYSSCAVTRALLGSASAFPFAERSWAQLF